MGWCSTKISPSNSQQACGFSTGATITMPLRMCDRLIFFRAKLAVWPPLTSRTGILFRWMLFTAIGVKRPRGSGPSSKVSFNFMIPFKVVPDTTVPTPCQIVIYNCYFLHIKNAHKSFQLCIINTHRYGVCVVDLKLGRLIIVTSNPCR